MMYVPAHVGCSPNEYADACAKSHLNAEEIEDATTRTKRWIETIPRIHEWQTEEGWMMSDKAMFGGMKVRAKEYARNRCEEGMEGGRISAKQSKKLWKGLGERAMRMTKVTESEQGATQKPTWEDIQTHMECVGVIMGLRNGDTIDATHEKAWERRRDAEGGMGGEATRCGEWGCAACLRKSRWEHVVDIETNDDRGNGSNGRTDDGGRDDRDTGDRGGDRERLVAGGGVDDGRDGGDGRNDGDRRDNGDAGDIGGDREGTAGGEGVTDGRDGRVERQRATMKHWLTGRCAGAHIYHYDEK